MTLVIPDGYAHVVHRLQQSGDAEVMVMTHGIALAGGGSVAAAAAQCDAAFDTLMGSFSNQFTYLGCEVTAQIGGPPIPPVQAVTTNNQVGGGTDPVAPQNNAYLIHKRTAAGGRTGRGRMYQPGVGEGAVNTVGALTSGILASLQTAYNGFLTSIVAGADIEAMVLLHDNGGAGATLDPTIITSLVVDPIIATQRRRLRR